MGEGRVRQQHGKAKGRAQPLGELAAVSEILRLQVESPDATAVLDAITARAAQLCAATDAHIFVAEGEAIRHAAGFAPPPAALKLGAVVPFDRGSVIARAVIDRTTVHVADFDALSPEEFSFTRVIVERSPRRWRTQLAVP